MKTVPLEMHIRACKEWIFGERELHLLPHLCEREKNSLDIGANIGIYTYFIRKYSRFCYAFEPNPVSIQRLENTFSRNVRVLPFCLSNKAGIVDLCVPYTDNKTLNSLGSIETENRLKNLPCKTIRVQSKRLDDLPCTSIGFIKIDVEGHELAVLEGSRDVIHRNKPNILIEIEERHKAGSITAVRSYLHDQGYSGYFLLNNQLTGIDNFEMKTHQNVGFLNDLGTNVQKGKLYINNFIFIPEGNAARLKERLSFEDPVPKKSEPDV
jgi:FkbM family methyltransferase